jgi:hypothetical protein
VQRYNGLVKRLLLAVVGIAGLVLAAAAFAAPASVTHWWFLRSGSGLPPALHKPVVVARGSWSAHRWILVAYPSEAKNNNSQLANGPSLCWGVTFTGKHRSEKRPRGYMIGGGYVAMHVPDDGMRCGSTVGIRTKQRYVPTKPPIDTELLVNQSANGYPSWFAGTVPAFATRVVIRWSALPARPGELARPSEVVRTRAFLAPVPGYRVRVAAAPLPRALSRHTHKAGISQLPTSIAAIDKQGRVVACFHAGGATCKP